MDLLVGSLLFGAAVIGWVLWLIRHSSRRSQHRDAALQAQWEGMQARQRIAAAWLVAHILMEEVAEWARRESPWWWYRP